MFTQDELTAAEAWMLSVSLGTLALVIISAII